MKPEELQSIKYNYMKEHIPLVAMPVGDGMANIENSEGYSVAHGCTMREAMHFVRATEVIIPALLEEIERLQAQNAIMREALERYANKDNWYVSYPDALTSDIEFWRSETEECSPIEYAVDMLEKVEALK